MNKKEEILKICLRMGNGALQFSRQGFLEGISRPVEAGLDCTHFQMEQVGDGGIGKVFDVPQEDHSAHIGREGLDGGSDLPHSFLPVRLRSFVVY